MTTLDGFVLFGTLAFIVLYGVWKTRGSKNMADYVRGGNQARWWTIGLSVMATQASAITFLSTPGQAYTDGMGFVQFYFGLPFAMVVLCITFIPIYYRLKVYTAYEYLEGRFDLKTRYLAAFLFLIQRGLAAGITIFAPAIILSTILGWRLDLTNLLIGTLVIIYTVSGGTKAVAVTQKHQMVVIMTGMFIAFFYCLNLLPEDFSLGQVMGVAGASGRMDVVDLTVDPTDRYNVWSGILGGFFLALSYFGTDQSQVGRYLSGKSIKESRLGLIFNGLLKVPMQFFILLVGISVFTFYQFNQAPIFFNVNETEKVVGTQYEDSLAYYQTAYDQLFEQRQAASIAYVEAYDADDESGKASASQAIKAALDAEMVVRDSVRSIIKKVNPQAETNDKDYVFIHWILNNLPKGLIGLLLAVIFSAAMSSTAAELNALATTTCVDFYERAVKPDQNSMHYVGMTKWFTVGWGLIAILFATFGTLFENLIQFVNIIGSIFYGTVLGIFLVAFYLKRFTGTPVFQAALVAQAGVIGVFFFTDIGFLWYNVIGCFGVIILTFLFDSIKPKDANILDA
ncbi:MAG: sodium:solute symporter [Bacteroidota bacterium]